MQVWALHNLRTKVDRDFGFFGIDCFLKMQALDCFWCKSVKGRAAEKGKNTIFSYEIRANLSFHIKFSYGVDFYHRKTAVGV